MKVGEFEMKREYIVPIDYIGETPPGNEELVRCKDCKHGSLYCTEDVCGETLIECNRPDIGNVIEIHGWKWFCADGERKD